MTEIAWATSMVLLAWIMVLADCWSFGRMGMSLVLEDFEFPSLATVVEMVGCC